MDTLANDDESYDDDKDDYDYDYDDAEDEEENEGEEDDEEIEQVHDRLLAAIDQFTKQPISTNGKSKKNKFVNDINMNEADNSLSLDALIGALSDSKDLRTVKKNLDDFEKSFSAPKNVEKVISQRVERTLQYGNVQKDMGKWQETVTANRHVKTLDLAKDKRQLPSHKSLVHKFEPETEMEKEIHMILLKSGGIEKTAHENELEELRGSGLTPQEIREKQASLAKVKALMFYEQLKRHRLNKIKSKAYRRIRKKQKQRLEQTQGESAVDEDDDEEQKEKNEKEALKRVQERMDLRHKNTNRWSKMALKYGRSDMSLRSAYHESVLLGQELSKKALQTNDGETDYVDDMDADSDFDENGDSSRDRPTGTTTAAQAAKKMKQTLDTMGVISGGDGDTGRYQKLLDMDFMRKATDRLSEKAKLEAQQVLLELQQMEAESEGLEFTGDDDRDLSAQERIEREEARQLQLQVREVKMREARVAVDGLLGTSGIFGKSSESGMLMSKKKTSVTSSAWSSFLPSLPDAPTQSSDNAAVDMPENPWLQKSQGFNGRLTVATGGKVRATGMDNGQIYVQLDSLLQKTDKRKEIEPLGSEQIKAHTIDTSNQAHGKTSRKAKKEVVVEATVPVAAKLIAAPTGKKEKKAVLLPTSQAELVQQAFAGPDLESDFANLKAKAVERELGIADNERKALSTGIYISIYIYKYL